ncbi:MAG TPA: hypothetical protein VFE54_10845, partial [Mucilaginibacter sp.]|nr:hypothetical protein [Mucilaginibacter sp.]
MGNFWNFIDSSLNDIKLNYFRIFLLFLIPFFLGSCNKQQKKPTGYSDAFVAISDVVTHFYDLNKPDDAISYLDKSFQRINKPSINDRFRFYGFHYVYWQKAKRNYKKALPYA